MEVVYTDLTYSILSPHNYEKLHLYADDPCRSSGISTANLHDCKYLIYPVQSVSQTQICVLNVTPYSILNTYPTVPLTVKINGLEER